MPVKLLLSSLLSCLIILGVTFDYTWVLEVQIWNILLPVVAVLLFPITRKCSYPWNHFPVTLDNPGDYPWLLGWAITRKVSYAWNHMHVIPGSKRFSYYKKGFLYICLPVILDYPWLLEVQLLQGQFLILWTICLSYICHTWSSQAPRGSAIMRNVSYTWNHLDVIPDSKRFSYYKESS
jgi:hypothetical protein